MPFFQNYVSKSKRNLKNSSARSSNSIRLPPYEVLENTYAATSVPNSKFARNHENDKPGQPDSELHQRSFSHRAVSEKKVLPQVSQITLFHGAATKEGQGYQANEVCTALRQAASQMLTLQQTGALKNAGMQSIFAALRAPVHVNFQFKDCIAKLIGVDPGKLQEISSNPEAQCLDLHNIQFLQTMGATTRSLQCHDSLHCVSCMQSRYIMATWSCTFTSQWS